jgi:sulfite reductase (NADPH) flavoprotein alpha-component
VVPCLPENAPFSLEQRAWINGYLAGLFSNAGTAPSPLPAATAPSQSPLPSLLILYGSQSGTAEGFARRLAVEASKQRFHPHVLEANAFATVDWTRQERLLLVTSTWGDGDPPDNAASFWAHLNSDAAPKLDHLSYSVLALGDRNYSDFCGAGKKFDSRFEALGAKRILPRCDCDADYEAAANAWMEALWVALGKIGEKGPETEPKYRGANGSISVNEQPLPPTRDPEPACSRSNPYLARLLDNHRLNTARSAKETRHLAIQLNGSGLTYEVGDALGVMPMNCPALVDEIIRTLGCDGDEAVCDLSGEGISLRHALLHRFEITKPTFSFLSAVAERSGDSQLRDLLEPSRKTDLDNFLHGREVIDFLLAFPAAKLTSGEFIGLLRALTPRLYSIASSLKAHPGEVHLCVGTVRYQSHGRARKGVCSTFLADRVEADTAVPVFVQPARAFRLPADGSKPIIMIGPGTGVAPFRAFLEERRAVGATGRNWLFFGEQCRASDFFYQEELESMSGQKSLTRLDTAFSRDQPEKVYVQHRMLEHARDLWAWLEEGAHVYVCGDAKRMAKDVDAALHEIIRTAGGQSTEQAAAYVREMKTAKRYQRDVY